MGAGVARRGAILLALALGCGSSPHGPERDGADGAGPPDAADGGAGDGDAAEASAASDAGAPFVLPVSPGPVDCGPYAALASCTLHVTPSGAPAADGLSWATALSDVQDALDRGTCGCDVWVARGTYLPPRGPDAADPDPRNRSFMLWNGSRLLGGFDGHESSAAERTAGGDATVLSGDLGVRGATDDNAYHVVVAGGDATLDGVTISGGFANGFNEGQGVGAGLLAVNAGVALHDVTVTDNSAGTGGGIWVAGSATIDLDGCTIARNVADIGGGLASSADRTTVADTVFSENVGVFVGGGLAFQGRALDVTGSTFLRNRGDFGASIALSSGSAEIQRAWFEGNVAGLFGGALFLRLGARGHLSNSVAVANSSVGHGGAVTVWTASLDIDSSTLADNSATFGGGLLIKDGARLSLTDSVLWRNSDDLGKTFFIEGEDNDVTITNTLRPDEIAGAGGFAGDPLLGNVPLATRFAEAKGGVDQMTLAQADQHFVAGDRVELGDDGVERRVTSVAPGSLTFSPAWPVATPRWLRIDRWAADAPSLKLDLTPAVASPLVDAAGPGAPAVDVTGRPRVGQPDIGAVER